MSVKLFTQRPIVITLTLRRIYRLSSLLQVDKHIKNSFIPSRYFLDFLMDAQQVANSQ